MDLITALKYLEKSLFESVDFISIIINLQYYFFNRAVFILFIFIKRDCNLLNSYSKLMFQNLLYNIITANTNIDNI